MIADPRSPVQAEPLDFLTGCLSVNYPQAIQKLQVGIRHCVQPPPKSLDAAEPGDLVNAAASSVRFPNLM